MSYLTLDDVEKYLNPEKQHLALKKALEEENYLKLKN